MINETTSSFKPVAIHYYFTQYTIGYAGTRTSVHKYSNISATNIVWYIHKPCATYQMKHHHYTRVPAPTVPQNSRTDNRNSKTTPDTSD